MMDIKMTVNHWLRLVPRCRVRFLLSIALAAVVLLLLLTSHHTQHPLGGTTNKKHDAGALHVRKLAELRGSADRPFLASDKENQVWWRNKDVNLSTDILFEDYNIAPAVMLEPIKDDYADYVVGEKYLYIYEHEQPDYPDEISMAEMNRSLFIRDSNRKGKKTHQKYTRKRITASKYKYSLYIQATSTDLGQQMFQYATLYGLSRLNRRIPVAAGKFAVWDVFRGSTMLKGEETVPANVTLLKETAAGVFTESLSTLPNDHIEICCYFHSYKYWSEYTRSVARQFRLHSHLVEQGQEYLLSYGKLQLRRKSQLSESQLLELYGKYQPKETYQFNYIAVHIYIDNLLNASQIKRGYKVAPPSYVHRAMEFYRKEYKNTLFVIFSSAEDKDWCKTHINTSTNDVIYANDTSQATVLATMLQCNHTVTTVGPLSWWAGWLNSGRTVYYSNFTVPGSEIDYAYNSNDYFSQSWMAMGD